MAPTVAVIGTGAMGSAVAQRLVEHGCRVLTLLEGRSAASRARAAAAGMVGVDPAGIAEAEFVLSIVPPAVALEVARALAPGLAAVARRGVYVDCNAVSPKTAAEIAAVIATTGWDFADAGIIGAPPTESEGTVIYAAGPAAARCAALAGHGINVHVLDGPIGAASALKMAYAGMSKGVTAICAAMVLAATRAGAAGALRAELAASRPELLAWADKQVPRAFAKAWRWVAEMQEIAEFSGDPATAQMYQGIAALYARLAADLAGPQHDVRSVQAFTGASG